MADATKTIEVIFGAVDSTKAGVRSALDGFDTFDKKVQSVAEPVANFTQSLIKVEAAIAAAGIAMAAISIKEAGQFGDAVLEIGTLFQGTHEQVETFNNDILEFGRNSTQSLTDITAATYTAISAGTDFNDSLELLIVTEKLAVAGVADLEATTRLVASSLNAYGEEVNQAERYSDALFTTVRLGQTTIPELASSLATVTGVASSAGIPFETLAAAVAALTANGVPTSEAITAIKAAITNIIKPTKDAEEAASRLGVEFNATALQTKGFDGLMRDLQEATGGNTEEMAKFFGSITGLNAALVLSKDSSGKFAEALQEMETKAGATQAAFELMGKAFSLVNQNLVNNIKATLIDAGKPLLEEYGDAVGAMASLFESLGVSVKAPEFQPVYDALNEFINTFSTTLDGVATALPEAMANVDFTTLIESFGRLGDEIGIVFDVLFGEGLDLTKPEDLAIALQRGVDIMATFVDLTVGIVNQFQPIFGLIGEAATQLTQAGTESDVAAGKVLGALTALSNFGTIIGGFLIYLNESQDDISKWFDFLVGTAKIALNDLQIIFGGFFIAYAEFVEASNLALSKVTFGETSAEFEKSAYEWAAKSESLKTDIVRNSRELQEGWSQMADAVTRDSAAAQGSIKAIGDESSATAPKMEDAADAANRFADEALNLEILEKVSAHLVSVNQALDENGRVLDNSTGKTGELVADFQSLTDAQKQLADALKLTNPSISDFEDALGNLNPRIISSLNATDDLGKKVQILEAAQKGMILEFVDGQKVFTGYGKEMSVQVTDKTNAAAEASDKAMKAMNELSIEMEKIASNERIKNLEFAVDFNIAKIEADAAKYTAALQSVADVAASISESIGVLAGIFADPETGRREQRVIEDIIERQEDRLDKELELQEKLIQAQIDEMTARAEAVNRGESLITIEAGGLEPELEAFMFKILQRIQVKVAADQDLFLANAGL
tara:strand:+ start:10946 stop:13819 length:2874 start_codon:yes stop_codon:yes gene_type:complete